MADPEYLTVQYLTTAEIARLFSKITIDPVKGCWLWNGGINIYGYGKIKFRRRDESPHRVMYAWLVGPLPRGQAADTLNLDHIVCDEKRCCFPPHLKLGTARDNILRSNNPAAINARRTHCKKGHELTKEPGKSNRRTCTICRKEWHQSERYRKWNAEFGRNYYQQRRRGPDGEAFIEHRKATYKAWKARKQAASHLPDDPQE